MSRRSSTPIIAIIILTVVMSVLPLIGLSFTLPSHNYPRLINLYWRTPITEDEARQLAKWDMVALSMQAQETSPDSIRLMRQLNPKIVILAYSSSNEIIRDKLTEVEPTGKGLWHELYATGSTHPDWQLQTADGRNITFWPGNISMNLNTPDASGQTYADFLTGFYADRILGTGLWDGILLDNIWQNVSWLDPDIDIDNDGRKDTADKANKGWQEGNRKLFSKLRARFSDRYLIIGNGDGVYEQTNGRMFEGFPEFWENGWAGSLNRYRDMTNGAYQPRVVIINSDTDNTGNQRDYQTMRFGLTSALMHDAYYSFDHGTQLREQLWWYDEYDINLGQPRSVPYNRLTNTGGNFTPGIWQRDFANGIVLVNSTAQPQAIILSDEYEQINGTQDTAINNGRIVDRFTLGANDGTILLRPITRLIGTPFINGAFARIFNSAGKNTRTGFFAFETQFKGGDNVVAIETNTDGEAEFIVANHSTVSYYDAHGNLIRTFHPYGDTFAGGISVAVADLDRNSTLEIITAPITGGTNQIKIFDLGGTEQRAWHGINKQLTTLGATVAVGNVVGDANLEIVVGAGSGSAPEVRVFDLHGNLVTKGFNPYDRSYRTGVSVAVGNTTGDDIDEIITGPGTGRVPEVKIFDYTGKQLGKWTVGDGRSRSGVRVGANDTDYDGLAEIITFTTDVFTSGPNLSSFFNQ